MSAVPLRSFIDELEKSLNDAEQLNARHQNLYANMVEDFATDIQILCSGIILPGHKYILSSRCAFLAKKFSSSNDVNELDWNAYESDIGIALLRWFYTDTVVADSDTVTMGLLRASHDLDLPTLFDVCERNLLVSVDKDNCSPKIYEMAQAVNATMLIDKCKECGSTFVADTTSAQLGHDADEDDLDQSSSYIVFESLDTVSRDEVMALMKRKEKLDENCKKLGRSLIGVREYMNFFDMFIWGRPAHKHILLRRSAKLRNEKSNAWSGLAKSNENVLLRWLYTDAICLDKLHVALALLGAAHKYELNPLFDICEQAVIKMLSITSCAQVHQIATKVNAKAALQQCERLTSVYWKCIMAELHEVREVYTDSIEDAKIRESPLEEAEDGTLLALNDDCLIYLFRFISLTDLGSVKQTCRRLNELADQSFKVYGNKSLVIRQHSMVADIWKLKHFGQFIESLTIDGVYLAYCSWKDALKIISRYANEHLKSFCFHLNYDESITENGLKCLKNVVKHVRKIELHASPNGECVESLLSFCENLAEVYIDSEELELNTLHCSKNKNIKSVTLKDLNNDNVLEEICEELPNLESFALIIPEFTGKLDHLSRLNHLKQFKVEWYDDTVTTALPLLLQHFASKNVLESLSISCSNLPAAVASTFSIFSRLKQLEFEYVTFSSSALNILSEKLNNVEELIFIGCDEITFIDITRIVLNQLNLKLLTISGCENIDFIDRKNYLRLRKRRNLQILLDKAVYEETVKLLANDLSDFVKIKIIAAAKD